MVDSIKPNGVQPIDWVPVLNTQEEIPAEAAIPFDATTEIKVEEVASVADDYHAGEVINSGQETRKADVLYADDDPQYEVVDDFEYLDILSDFPDNDPVDNFGIGTETIALIGADTVIVANDLDQVPEMQEDDVDIQNEGLKEYDEEDFKEHDQVDDGSNGKIKISSFVHQNLARMKQENRSPEPEFKSESEFIPEVSSESTDLSLPLETNGIEIDEHTLSTQTMIVNVSPSEIDQLAQQPSIEEIPAGIAALPHCQINVINENECITDTEVNDDPDEDDIDFDVELLDEDFTAQGVHYTSKGTPQYRGNQRLSHSRRTPKK